MGNIKQITNTIGVGLVGVFLLFTFIGGLIFSSGKGLLTLSGLSLFVGVIIFIVYFLFLIKSFSKTNLDNSYFNWAFYLNLCTVIMYIVSIGATMVYASLSAARGSFVSVDKINFILDIFGIFGILLFLTSFIVFIMGYFKNKL